MGTYSPPSIVPHLCIYPPLRTIRRMDVFYYMGLGAVGFAAGLIGALLGLGGGIFVVPALILGFHVPAIVAVGTSNVVVMATSTVGASTYVRRRMSNIRLGLVLLVSTTAAAVISSLLASRLPGQVLSGLFAVILLYTAVTMLRSARPADGTKSAEPAEAVTSDPLGLAGRYYDISTGKDESYAPRNVRTGMGLNVIAGVMSGLLGVGGGAVQVPVMNLVMRVPLKVAAATSNYMVGVTATSAAIVRYVNGDVNPLIAVPTILTVFLGVRAGTWLVPRTPNALLKRIFGWVAIAIAALMVLQALGIYRAPGK